VVVTSQGLEEDSDTGVIAHEIGNLREEGVA
jgi:hypothetical protein